MFLHCIKMRIIYEFIVWIYEIKNQLNSSTFSNKPERVNWIINSFIFNSFWFNVFGTDEDEELIECINLKPWLYEPKQII